MKSQVETLYYSPYRGFLLQAVHFALTANSDGGTCGNFAFMVVLIAVEITGGFVPSRTTS